MHANGSEIGTSVVPVMRYRDLPAAIDWLCKAFGFAKHRVTAGTDNTIMFAQLTFGKAMVMVGPVRASAFDNLLKQPDEIGGAETQVCYFHVADAHAHCAQAKAAGAEIIFNIEDEINGGRSYSCRDPEGHLWNFGTYDPWQRSTQDRQRDRGRSGLGDALKRLIVTVGLLVAIVATLPFAARIPSAVQQFLGESTTVASTDIPSEASTKSTLDELASERSARNDAEHAEREAREQLTSARTAAERAATEAREKLTQALSDKEAAEQAGKEARERLVRAWIGKEAAERAAKEARRQLARERSARRAAESAQPAISPQSQSPMPRWQ